MKELFDLILYQPIFNAFVGLYNLIPDVGIVILILTVLIKLLLYPMTSKSITAQKSLADMQPKVEELKKKYKDDQQTLAQETMKLYKEHKINPFGSCLPLLLQLPIFIALYYVLRDGLANQHFESLYSFVARPEVINTVSLGFVDLGKPQVIIAALAAGAQYWQAKMMQTKRPPKIAGEGAKDESMATMMNKQMLYVLPIMTLLIGLQFPGGLALYWFLSTLLTALQQKLLIKGDKGDKNGNGGVIEGTLVK